MVQFGGILYSLSVGMLVSGYTVTCFTLQTFVLVTLG